MNDPHRTPEGMYIEAGEDVSPARRFSADEVANAFGVEKERVLRAMRGEFGLGPEATIDDKQAQDLVEVLFGDLPFDQREAATMKLGAFTPRRDAEYGLGSGPPEVESDRESAKAGTPPDELASKRSSHAPTTRSS